MSFIFTCDLKRANASSFSFLSYCFTRFIPKVKFINLEIYKKFQNLEIYKFGNFSKEKNIIEL